MALNTLRSRLTFGLVIGALLAGAGESGAQRADHYRPLDGWAKLPPGRTWGQVTGVHPDPDGRHIWVLDRCGADSCVGSPLDPVMKFDLDGNLVASFGAGLFAWPHGFFVDHEGHPWVTDGVTGARAEAAAREGLGQVVIKFRPDGSVALRLGTPGVTGAGPNAFNGPNALTVAPDGTIFVTDGHGTAGNQRVAKFSSDGRYLGEWGTPGPGPAAGEFSDPHAIALDSGGRLLVADRGNARIQIFDQDGTFLDQWTHFGPVSGIYIDANDLMYVTDAPSTAVAPWIAEGREEHANWVRGIRVGDARTGRVYGLIPSDAEYVTADAQGNVYAALIQGRDLIKHVRVRPLPTSSR